MPLESNVSEKVSCERFKDNTCVLSPTLSMRRDGLLFTLPEIDPAPLIPTDLCAIVLE